MAVVRIGSVYLRADLLTDITSLGSDDGITSDMIAWVDDQNNFYYPNVISASTSTWTALATGGGGTWAAVLSGGATSGGTDPVLSSGDTLQGEDATGANAGDLDMRGGNVTGVGDAGDTVIAGGTGGTTSGAGGSVLFVPGLVTSGTVGLVGVDAAVDVDEIMFRLDRSDGTVGSISDIYVGQDIPSFTAKAGSLYLQNDGLNSDGGALWVQEDATGASDDGNTWTQLGSGGGAGGAVSGVTEVFDNRGAPTTTGSATASGGTVDFTLAVGASYGEIKYLRVRTASGTCADATIQFFQDSGRTVEIYDAENKDTSTTNGWVDRNPSTMMADDGTGLASSTLYGRITNNDAGVATFDVELVFWADESTTGIGPLLYTTGAAKTGAYTAVAGEHVRYDTSGGTFTVSMPASPSANQRVGVVETAGDTTTLTVSGNGNNIVDPDAGSVAGTATVSLTRGSVIWKWDDTDNVWRVE